MSEFLILIYDGTSWENANEHEAARITAGHMKFAEHNGAVMRGGNALQPASTATTVAPDGAGGFTVTDGPFAETKEALGGYYLIEAPTSTRRSRSPSRSRCRSAASRSGRSWCIER